MTGDLTPVVGSAQTYIDVICLQKEDQRIMTEEITCLKTGDQIEVKKIPLHARRLALGDIVAVEYDENDRAHYFSKRVMPSGNTTVRILFEELKHLFSIRSDLEERGCETEFVSSMRVMAVNVPKHIPYAPIRRLLSAGEQSRWWQFDEPCLSHPVLMSIVPDSGKGEPMQKHLDRIGILIQRERFNRDESQESLAGILGITVAALKRIESGMFVGVDFVTMLAICQRYNIRSQELFGDGSFKRLSIC